VEFQAETIRVWNTTMHQSQILGISITILFVIVSILA